ncbi:hypothetical protein GGD41_001983 [Paraburkholderia bryophila]|uniref:Uncharacterized protein n=1 Tax=Paraburkholderia bryophila TaxID=420952 RepID=A0A7Y9W5U8_9BURK|nr:hypothetical protein [Paraburkholderia bryophila]
MNAGATAPVVDEVDLIDLPVAGTLPPELNGVLMRNGPNPLSGRFAGNDVLSWWPEAAMLHAISFQQGRALRYCNRWARTKRWAQARDFADVSPVLDTNPNVNVLVHGGEILALAEGGAPLAITAGLATLGAAPLSSGPDARHDRASQSRSANRRTDDVSRRLGKTVAALRRDRCARQHDSRDGNRIAIPVSFDDARHGDHGDAQHSVRPQRRVRLFDVVARLSDAFALA